MKRLFALILALAMVLSMVPPTALQVHAEEVTPPEETTPATVAPVETTPATTAPAETEPATEPVTVTVPVSETEPETEVTVGPDSPLEDIVAAVKAGQELDFEYTVTGTVMAVYEAGDSTKNIPIITIAGQINCLYIPNNGADWENVAEGDTISVRGTVSLKDDKVRIVNGTLVARTPAAPDPTEPVETEPAVTASGTCGDSVYWTLEDGVLTIWGEGEMDAEYVWPWEDQREAIKTVVIEDGVTYIVTGAFSQCYALTSVTIPNSLTRISANAFSDCENLSNITLSNGVNHIGHRSFYNCDGLTSIVFPDTLRTIYSEVFYDCDGLTSVTIPDSVEEVYERAFKNCTNLETATIGDGTTFLGISVFASCTNLKTVTLGKNVSHISGAAFGHCTSLTEITFTGDAPEFLEGVFTEVTATAYYPANNPTWTSDVMQDYGGTITWVSYDAEDIPPASSDNKCGLNAYWSLEDGVLTIWGEGEMEDYANTEDYADAYEIWWERADEITSIVVQSGITRIGNSAFRDLVNVTSVSLPDGLESIGYGAFRWCESLTSIDIPETVTALEERAFAWTGLTSVTIPAGVTEIAEGLFSYCESLQSVTIEGPVTIIGDEAFHWCGLRSFTIPETVTHIGYDAFHYNPNLTYVSEIPASVISIDGNVFADCYDLPSIKVADDNPNYCDVDGVLFNKAVTELIAFPCKHSSTYTVPATVETIGDYAFSCADYLHAVTIPEGVTTFGDYAFFHTGLSSIVIPASVTSIGKCVFTSSQLSSIKVAAGNPNYCDVNGVLFDKAVTTLIAFPNYHDVCIIPPTVTTIETSAFYSHIMLRVTIPASVTYIGKHAFGAFEGTLVFEGNAPALYEDTIYGDNINGVFIDCDITAYYPEDATGWADVISQELEYGTIQWISYGEEGVPALGNTAPETALPLELDESVFVEAGEYDTNKYYTFTPDESGYYVIYTEGEACPDFAVYALNEDGYWIECSSWTNCSYDLGRLHLMPMIADRTYGFELHYYGRQSDCYLTVEQSNITKVEIADVEIYEYSHGDYVQPEDYYRYDFSDLIHYTVYYDDGTQKTGPEVDSDGDTYNFRYIWKEYELYFSNPYGYAAIEQSEENQWTVGNSYDAYCSFLGSEHSLKVSIVEAPENITINLKPIKVHKDAFEMLYGGIDVNGDDVFYKYYRWIEAIGGTVTVNGTVCDLRLTYMGGDIFSWFYYDPDPTDETNGYKCRLWFEDGQCADNEWEVGGTYEVTVGVLGVETTVEVTVYDEWSGAEALTLNQPVCVEDLEHDSKAHFTFTPAENGYYMFYTSGESTPEMSVYLLQPSGNWDYWDYENGHWDAYTDEGYVCGYVRIMPMTAGTTYGFVSTCYYDESISFSAAVEKVDISDVQVSSEVNIYEYTHGHWDGYDGYWGEAAGYYRYDNLAELIDYTVIHADGSSQTNSLDNTMIQLNGKNISINRSWIYGNNYQESDNRWTAGNSYELGIEIFGQVHDFTVNILPAPENITLQLDPVTASVQDYDWYYEDFGDGEEIEWRAYNWSHYINGTITIGTETYNIRNGRFYFPDAGYYCELWTRDAQAWDNLWSVGNTYAGTAGTLGVSAECDVTIANIDVFDSQLLELIDQAPALSEMTVLTLDTLHPFSVERGGEIGWFTFTPEEDGIYSFSSSDVDDSYCDPRAWLFDSNFNALGRNDDSGNSHFNIMHELTAGETYILAAQLYNQYDTGTFNVSVIKALDVTEIQLDPISIPADAWCEVYTEVDADGSELNFTYYYWWESLNGKLYFDDGNYVVINGTSVQYNGVTYHLETFDNQGDDVWVAGNSYPVTVTCGNATLNTTVKITAPAIKSFSVKPVTMLENEEGYYYWINRISWTANFKDGKKVSGNGSYFTYKNNTYIVSYRDDQYENPYLPGNTYTVYAMIGTHTVPVSLTIKDMDPNLPGVEQLRVKAVKPTSVQVGFNKVAGAVKYDLYRNGAYVTSITGNTYTFTGLEAGYYYEFGVAAVYNIDGKQVSSPVTCVIEKSCTSISNFTLALEYATTVYDGTEKMPEVTLKNGKTVISPEFYEYQISNNVEIGQAIISVSGLQQYGGMLFKSFKILPQQVTELEVTEVTEDSATITFEPVYGADEYWIYNGKTLVAKITDTTYTFEGLKAGTNYTFSVRANTIVEEYVLEGFDPYADSEPSTRMADYTGEAATVSSKPTYEIDGFTVKLGSASVAYTGKKLQPSVTVLNEDGKKLTAKKDYTVAYSDNVDVGTATVTVTGTGKYSGTITTTFDIVPAKPKSGKVTGLSGTSAQLEIRPVAQAQWYDVYVDDQYLGRTSELTYVAENLTTNKNIKFYVRAGATIEGKDYIGEMSPPAPVVLKHNMSICTVMLAENTLVYTGKKLQPEVTVTGHEGAVLTKGVDYTVAYKNNTGTGVATVTVTGKGAYTGKATAEFVIMPAPVTNLAVKSTTPTSVTISFTKTASAQYYYIYVDDAEPVKTNKTTYTIKDLAIGDIHSVYVVSEKTVKGVTYLSDPCAAIQVWAGTDIAKFKATLEYSRGTYEGQPLSPSVVLKTSSKKTATTLVEGVDYIIEYVGNDAPGKAKAVIKGIGQYAGSITKTFTIFMKNPTGLTATAIDPNTIHVEFDAVPGATKYQILVGGKVKATITEGTSCDITGLKKNTTYTIKVKAVYVSGTYTQNTTSAAVKVKTPSA